MKEYLIDQLLYMAVMIAIMLCIPVFCGPVFTVLLEVTVLLTTAYVCKRALLLPIDLILGKVEKEVYFSGIAGTEMLEFYRKKCCCLWKFYHGGNAKLVLLVPRVVDENGLKTMEQPLADQKMSIVYYRCSKILCSWEPTENKP